MVDSSFPKAEYVTENDRLDALIDTLAREPLLAIDTESNSLYAYREHVCLVQISTRKADFIIDPLAVTNLNQLGQLLVDPNIEKVFHAAEYDLICLKRDYGFEIVNLFDTHIAARICGFKNVGLSSMLQQYFDVKNDKRHQRDNWGQRPLSEDSLVYAQMDTHYLPRLRDIMADELSRLDRWKEANESFADSCMVEVPNIDFDPDGYWDLGVPNQLNRMEMAVLRELYLLRDRIARDRDMPAAKVVSDKTLVGVAQALPENLNDLANVPGLSPPSIRRFGKAILSAVARGERSKLPPQPDRNPPIDPAVVECYTVLREWRKERARDRGVESDVILPKDTLWTLATRTPESLEDMNGIRGLGPWRLETYGEELLEIIRQYKEEVSQ